MPTSALCCAETTTAEMRLGVPSSYSTLTCALPSGRRYGSSFSRRTCSSFLVRRFASVIGSGISAPVSQQA